MKLRLARATFLLLTLSTCSVAAFGFWSFPTSFPLHHPSLIGLAGASLVVAVVAFVACFSPFDRPGSAPRWAAPLAGLAVGIALMGLVLFTPSFLWLALPLFLLAYILRALAKLIARETLERHEEAEREAREVTEETEAPAYSKKPPYSLLMINLLLLVSMGLGAGLTWAWRPYGNSRPLALESEVAPVVSAVRNPKERQSRVVKTDEVVEFNGMEVNVKVGLRRPQVTITLRRQTIVIEPCLRIEEGTIDGFFYLHSLNGYSLEPAGPAEVNDLAETDLNTENRGWVRATYKAGAVEYGKLAGVAPSLGRRAGPGTIEATLEVEVLLDGKRVGRVTVDATTTLGRPAAVHRASLARVRVIDVPHRPVTFGLGSGLALVPQQRAAADLPERLEFLVTDGDVVRVLRARRGDLGPYETLDVGKFDGWMVLPGKHQPFMLVAPDWQGQASIDLSRGAGHGLPQNALLTWYENNSLNMLFDLGSGRIGPGGLPAQLPAGIYRNRMVIRLLGVDSARGMARTELNRISGTNGRRASTEGARFPGG